MSNSLQVLVQVPEDESPGARLGRVVRALAVGRRVDDGSWQVQPAFSASLRARLTAENGEPLPYRKPMDSARLRALLEARPEDVDALRVEAMAPIWVYARTHRPREIELDLASYGLELFTETAGHPLTAAERERAEVELAEAEAAHEHWRVGELRAARNSAAETVHARALDWFFALVEGLANHAEPASLLVGRSSPGVSPSLASMAWYPDVEAFKEALDHDGAAHGRYVSLRARTIGRALERAGDRTMSIGAGILITNPELSPVGVPIGRFLDHIGE